MSNKFYLGNIRGAVHFLASKDTILPCSNETYETLELKHPKRNSEYHILAGTDNDNTSAI